MDRIQPQTKSMRKNFATIIKIIAGLMIVFGAAEVITSFSHQFFGLNTPQSDLATAVGALVGIFYIAGGLLLLTRRTWAAILAIILLCGDILGRISMVVAGLYPVEPFRQSSGSVAGTAMAIVFTIYIFMNPGSFQTT